MRFSCSPLFRVVINPFRIAKTEFWTLGHKLFCSTAETFPATFVAGSVLDAEHVAVAPVAYSPSEVAGPRPVLSTLTSLNPLRGHVSAIHAGAFFHLFDEEQQLRIAHALGGLLSPEPGSMIVGSQGGAPEKGIRVVQQEQTGSISQFLHSIESWKELWNTQVFKQGTVKVDASMEIYGGTGSPQTYYYMSWSVTRL